MALRTCQICGYTQAPEKKNCPACGWAANSKLVDEVAKLLEWENRMIQQIRAVYPTGMAPAGSTPLDPMSVSIVLALKDSPFSDDADRVCKSLAAKSYLILRLAKIKAAEQKANALYDYGIQLAYGGENTIFMGTDKELLILLAHFTPLVTPP